ncbi:MAG: DUF2922 domain-containing protein [Eubacteriaceae bacterium]
MPTYKLQMIFEVADGKSFCMTIPDVNVDLNETQAVACANAILASGVIEIRGENLTKLLDVKKIVQTVDDFYTPPKA